MREELDAADAEAHHGVLNGASSLAMMMSQGQISMRPPAMHLPCTAAIVGFGMLRQRSQRPR